MVHIPSQSILSFKGKKPSLGQGAFVAPGSYVIGDVRLGEKSGVWFNAVLRGDINSIVVGDRSNIQDNAVIHVVHGTGRIEIGNDVTVGHSAVLHGCKVGDRCIIGMGAVVLDGAEIGSDSIVAAGALVTPGKSFQPKSLIVGAPAKFARQLSDAEIEQIKANAEEYVSLAIQFMSERSVCE